MPWRCLPKDAHVFVGILSLQVVFIVVSFRVSFGSYVASE
jgi:hypothetical protein